MSAAKAESIKLILNSITNVFILVTIFPLISYSTRKKIWASFAITTLAAMITRMVSRENFSPQTF